MGSMRDKIHFSLKNDKCQLLKKMFDSLTHEIQLMKDWLAIRIKSMQIGFKYIVIYYRSYNIDIIKINQGK